MTAAVGRGVKPSRYNLLLPTESGGVLYNSRSGALIAFTTEQFNLIRDVLAHAADSIQPIYKELTEGPWGDALVDACVFVDRDLDELEELRLAEKVRRQGVGMLNIVVVLTTSCDLECRYCYQKQHGFIHRNSPLLIQKSRFDRALTRFAEREIPSKAFFNVRWYGGEPLLEWPRILSLSKMLRGICVSSACKYSADIVTNGFLLTRRKAKVLAELDVKRAEVTLDGTADVHNRRRPAKGGEGSFDRILNNLLQATDYIERVVLRINLDSTNISSAHKLLEVIAPNRIKNLYVKFSNLEGGLGLEKWGLKKMSFEEFSLQVTGLSKHARELGVPVENAFPAPNMVKCPAVQDNFMIFDPFGRMHKCFQQIGDYQYATGRLSTDGTVVDTEYSSYWRDWSVFNDAKCCECFFLPICMGGCPYNRVIRRMKRNEDITFLREEQCIRWRYNLHHILRQIAETQTGDKATHPALPNQDQPPHGMFSSRGKI